MGFDLTRLACIALTVIGVLTGLASAQCDCTLPYPKPANPLYDITCGLEPSTAANFPTWKSPEEWKSRTVYQLLTDRFASSDERDCGPTERTGATYCGGTYKAMIQKLPYIKSLGFDAIWISPIPNNKPGSYHGYHMENMYEVNEEFGTAQDLKDFVNEAHKLGIWVMVDIVGNHMSDRTPDKFYPFNNWDHFHTCDGCPQDCGIDFSGAACGYGNPFSVEKCRLAGLKDLDQDKEYVSKNLIKWIQCIMGAFGFDGIRVDTVPEVKNEFWGKMRQSLPDCHFIGEVFNGCHGYVASYEARGENSPGLPGLLHYGLYYQLLKAFGMGQGEKFYNYQLGQLADQANYFASTASIPLWGTFLDNHDNQRFLNQFPQNDQNYQYRLQLLHNALTFMMLHHGIPIIYYGTEQRYSGGTDPRNREPLWYSKYDQTKDTYKIIAGLNRARRAAQAWKYPVKEWWRGVDDVYAFTHGPVLAIVSNRPWKDYQKTLKVGNGGDGIPANTQICNIFSGCKDCVRTDGNNVISVSLDKGESKVYLPNCTAALSDITPEAVTVSPAAWKPAPAPAAAEVTGNGAVAAATH